MYIVPIGNCRNDVLFIEVHSFVSSHPRMWSVHEINVQSDGANNILKNKYLNSCGLTRFTKLMLVPCVHNAGSIFVRFWIWVWWTHFRNILTSTNKYNAFVYHFEVMILLPNDVHFKASVPQARVIITRVSLYTVAHCCTMTPEALF